jgi:hypothetical protein
MSTVLIIELPVHSDSHITLEFLQGQVAIFFMERSISLTNGY